MSNFKAGAFFDESNIVEVGLKYPDAPADGDGGLYARDVIRGVELPGGGGGDFSTAEVTFINSSETASIYYVKPFAYATEENTLKAMTVKVETSEVVTFAIPASGKYEQTLSSMFGNIDYSIMPTTSGGVELNAQNGTLVITGNGTFSAAGTYEN